MFDEHLTDKVALGRELRTPEGVEYTECTTIPDGNCGYYSFAFFLILAIKRGHHIPDETYDVLLAAIKDENNLRIIKQRANFYNGEPLHLSGDKYPKLVKILDNFVNFFADPTSNVTRQKFEDIIKKEQGREFIAATEVALGPALRKMGCDLLEFSTGKKDANMRRDEAYASYEILSALGNRFRLEVTDCPETHFDSGIINIDTSTQMLFNDDAGTNIKMHLLHNARNHFNPLIPKSEVNFVVEQMLSSPIHEKMDMHHDKSNPNLESAKDPDCNDATETKNPVISQTESEFITETESSAEEISYRACQTEYARMFSHRENKSAIALLNDSMNSQPELVNDRVSKYVAANLFMNELIGEDETQFNYAFDLFAKAVQENDQDDFVKAEQNFASTITPRSKL